MKALFRSVTRRFRLGQQGYTLVIIASIFAAFAMVAGAYIDRSAAGQQVNRQQETRARMGRLAVAIQKYYAMNDADANGTPENKYPCPASYNVVPSASTFGKGWTSSGSPYCNVAPSVGESLLSITSQSQLAYGMVPVTDLAPYGIDPSDAFDGYNGRIMYGMNRLESLNGSGTATQKFTVTKQTNNSLLMVPSFILVSYGRDRVGGYLRSQTSFTSPAIACGGTANPRDENCDLDVDFLGNASYTSPTASSSNYYDDMVLVSSGNAVSCTAVDSSWTTWVNASTSTCNSSCLRSRTRTCVPASCGGSTATCTAGQTETLTDVNCSAGQGACPAVDECAGYCGKPGGPVMVSNCAVHYNSPAYTQPYKISFTDNAGQWGGGYKEMALGGGPADCFNGGGPCGAASCSANY